MNSAVPPLSFSSRGEKKRNTLVNEKKGSTDFLLLLTDFDVLLSARIVFRPDVGLPHRGFHRGGGSGKETRNGIRLRRRTAKMEERTIFEPRINFMNKSKRRRSQNKVCKKLRAFRSISFLSRLERCRLSSLDDDIFSFKKAGRRRKSRKSSCENSQNF